ncbi:hypothetical protein CUMW_268490 [Citrus unshiu]|uniref:Cyclin N-terminal domain-containing protein n=1 Tax=Citrus unshiu TaxID=55188 RepID=A0A2H5QWI4_CITUN|nr:hypothetical protein CUMW_268490 [Citrus unshiu]
MVLNGKLVESETYSSLGLVDSPGKKSSSTPRVLSILSSVLERSIQKNESSSKASKKKEVVTIFHCSKAPSLSIRQYIERVFKYSRCSPSCFIVAYIYLDRFLQRINGCLTRLNVHHLLITSFLVAAKFVDDDTAEMNKLEMNFLFTLELKLHVTTEVFAKYCSQLDMEGAAAEEWWVSPMIEALGTKLGRLNRDGKI